MQHVRNYKQIGVLLAIVVVFSTVAPVRALAENASILTNVVFSSETTGGVQSKGHDGQDGEDGAPGQDGKPGISGSSVITIEGKSTQVNEINSVMSETKVVSTQITSLQNATLSSSTAQHTTTSSPVEIPEDFVYIHESASNEGVLVSLKEAILSLQLMLVTYVNLLF